MIIEFKDVGRDKFTWQQELPNSYEPTLLKAIMRKGVLRSREVWCDSGNIYAGGRLVGTYRDVSSEQSIAA